jgi:hypothetical protein
MSLSPTPAAILECCSCRTFAEAVAGLGPYSSLDALIDAARSVWWHQVSGLRLGRSLCRVRVGPGGAQTRVQHTCQACLPLNTLYSRCWFPKS